MTPSRIAAMPPPISLFPKCYFDDLVDGTRSFDSGYGRPRRSAARASSTTTASSAASSRPTSIRSCALMDETGQITSMICFSPDFTHPDGDERNRQVERQKAAIDLTVRLGARHCRTLSGQRHPGMSRAEGIARTARRHPPFARIRGVARRRPVHGEPLQGRDLALPGVRAAGRHLSRNRRADRLAALRRSVRSLERRRRRLRSGRRSSRR